MIIDHETDPYAIELDKRLKECIISILSNNSPDDVDRLDDIIGTISTCIMHHRLFICNIIYDILMTYIKERHIKELFGHAMFHRKCIPSVYSFLNNDIISYIISVLQNNHIIFPSDIRGSIMEIGSYRS